MNKKNLAQQESSQRGAEAAIWNDILAGCAGGLVGGWTMSQFTRFWRTLPTARTELLPYSPQEWDAASGIAEIVARRIFGRSLSEREKKTGVVLVHYAMAAAAGALYGTTSARWMPRKTRWRGALLGTAMWMLGNELLMPALRLAKRPSHYSFRMQADALGEHIVYGLTTDLIYYEVKKYL